MSGQDFQERSEDDAVVPKPRPDRSAEDGWGQPAAAADDASSSNRLRDDAQEQFSDLERQQPSDSDGWGTLLTNAGREPESLAMEEGDAAHHRYEPGSQRLPADDGWGEDVETSIRHEVPTYLAEATPEGIDPVEGNVAETEPVAEDRPPSRETDVDELAEPDTQARAAEVQAARDAVSHALEEPAAELDPTALGTKEVEGLPISRSDIDARTTDNRINLADNVPRVLNSPEYGGYLDIVMHGDASGTQANVDGQSRDFTLEETASMIESSPNWDERPIRLLSCSTGQDHYAQDLADRLDVPVYAPSDILEVGPSGKFFIYGDGSWRRFEPVIK